MVAWTDSIATHGIDEAIRRGNLYRAAGADMISADAPDTKDEIKRLASETNAPISINMIEGGKTPILTLAESKALGVAGVGYPLTAIFAAAKAIERSLSVLLGQGSSIELTNDPMPFDPFTELLGLETKYQLDDISTPCIRLSQKLRERNNFPVFG